MTSFFKPLATLLFACYSCSVVPAEAAQAAQAAPSAAQSNQLAELVRDADRLGRKFKRSFDAIEQRKDELKRQFDELEKKQSGLAQLAGYLTDDLKRMPAEFNDGKALWRMGQLFETGGMGEEMDEEDSDVDLGLGPDLVEAMTWYKRAATWHNYVHAQYDLGLLHLEGRKNDKGFWIVRQEAGEAAKWFEQAAKQDHPEAQYLLAALLVKGWGIRKNPVEAEKWLAKAAENGMKIDRAAFDKLQDTPFADWAAGLE